jgi:hypothetical protein
MYFSDAHTTEIKTYCDGVIALAKTLKTNNSNFIWWQYDEIEEAFNKNVSIEDLAASLAEYTEKGENEGWLIGEQNYDSYEESKKAAIAVVNRVNKRDNNKWKNISMTSCGNWTADDANSEDMVLTKTWWANPKGFARALDINCSNTDQWKESLTKIL